MQIIPEIAAQNIIQVGINRLKDKREYFDEIFCYLVDNPFMNIRYGKAWVDKQWNWFTQTKIRVLQSYSLSNQTVPSYSIKISSESEDVSKAAINDGYGFDDNGNELGIAAFSCAISIGIHADKSADQVIVMKRILNYILFKEKSLAQDFGIEIQTVSTSPHQKDDFKFPENIYSMYTTLSVIFFNTWRQYDATGPYDLETGLILENLKNEQVSV